MPIEEEEHVEDLRENEDQDEGVEVYQEQGPLPLPPGWVANVASSGRVYFTNFGNRQTTWTDPRTGEQTVFPANSIPAAEAQAVDALDALSINRTPLPPGWVSQVAPTGRTFFVNFRNNKTTFRDPRTGQLTPMSIGTDAENKKISLSLDSLDPLPTG